MIKRERIKILEKILPDMGKKSAAEVFERFCKTLPAADFTPSDTRQVESYKRSVYRDLRDLAKEGRVREEIFSLIDGRRIDETVAKGEGTCRREYIWNDCPVVGNEKLRKLNGNLCLNDKLSLAHGLTIDEFESGPIKGAVNFIFNSSLERLNLALSYPTPLGGNDFFLVVGRNSGADENPIFTTKDVQLLSGKLAVLTLVISKLSQGFEKSPGHFFIKLVSSTRIEIRDNNSTNGTTVRDLNASEVSKLLQPSRRGTVTDTENPFDAEIRSRRFKKVAPTGDEWKMVRLPALISASDSFSMLVMYGD